MFEQEYTRANDRIHPRKDLLKEMEEKWAQQEQTAKTERPPRTVPAWVRYASLAAGIVLCVGLGMEAVVLFGRSRGIEKKSVAAEAPMVAEAAVEPQEEEAKILYEAPTEAEMAEDMMTGAAEPETMLAALKAADAAPQGMHLALDEAEVEDAVRFTDGDRGQAKAAGAVATDESPAGQVMARDDLLAVFLPTLDQVHVIQYANRRITNVFALTVRERGAQVKKVFWMGSELLAVREKGGETELLRFDVADWKSPRHLQNLTQSGTCLGAWELNGRLYVLSLYEATDEEPLPWVNGNRMDFDRVLLDAERPGDTFTVLTAYEPGAGDGFAAETALLREARGAVAGAEELFLWAGEGETDLYAFACGAEGLTLRAEGTRPGAVLSAAAAGQGAAFLFQEGDRVSYAALDGDLHETASAAASGVGSLRGAEVCEDGALLLTDDTLHYLTAVGDRTLAITGDGVKRLSADRALVLTAADGRLQLVSLGADGLTALGETKARGGLGPLLTDMSRIAYDPATGRLVVPAGQNVYPFQIDAAGKITLRGETQVFNDHNEAEQREIRVLLFEDTALIFFKNGVALCNQYLARQSNLKY